MSNLLDSQPDPVPNDNPVLWEEVIKDIGKVCPYSDSLIDACRQRDAKGFEHYGTHLQIHNGRDFSADAYQEILDFVVYLKGKCEELRIDGNQLEFKQYEWFYKEALMLAYRFNLHFLLQENS